LPIVRATGGLFDTVRDLDEDPSGNGFLFGPAEPHALAGTVARAAAAYRDRDRWRDAMIRGMREDFSWDGPARAYEDLYRSLRQSRRSR
jgi:starch synthase